MLDTKFQGQAFNVNINQQGAMSAQREMQQAQGKDTTNRMGEVLQSAAGLANTVSNIQAEQQAAEQRALRAQASVDASEAKNLYITTVTNQDYLSGTDTNKAETLEKIMGNTLDRSEAFSNSFKGYAAGAYSTAYTGRLNELRESKLNQGGAVYTAWKEEPTYNKDGMTTGTNRNQGLGAADWAEMMYNNDPSISKTEWGQVALNEDYSLMYADVINATPDTIADVQSNIVEIKAGLQSNFLLNSREKKTVAANSARETQLQGLITAKAKQFKVEAKNQLAAAFQTHTSNTILGTDPLTLEGAISTATTDDLAALKQYNSLKKSYDDQKVRVEFLNSNIPGEVVSGVVPPEAADAWQEEVTDAALGAISSNNYSEFNNIVNFSPKESKDIGNELYQGFLQAKSTAEMQPSIDFMKVSMHKPGGATALRQTLGDNYPTVIATMYIADSVYDGDLIKAREHIQQSASNLNIIKMGDPMKVAVDEYAIKLKTQGQAYATTINKLWQVDPTLAKKEYINMASWYLKQTETKDGIHINKSMSTFHESEKALDKDDVHNALVSNFIAKTDNEPSTMTYLTGGQVLMTDALNGSAQVVDGKVLIEKSNAAVLETRKREEQIKAEAKRNRQIGEGDISGTLDQLSDLPATDIAIDAIGKIGSGLGGVFNKFSNYLRDETYKGLYLKTPTQKRAARDLEMEDREYEELFIKRPFRNTLGAYISLDEYMNRKER